MMTYAVKLWEPAKKKYLKLNRKQRAVFDSIIDKVKENPKSFGKPMHFPLKGKWTYRFEKRFRIVFVIDDKNKVIEIEAIKHKDEF
ncbi:MAG: hypothetical protein KKE96_02490 [Candidatus Altiarchaeota archaeon]|nr:hypothetical protein [Candidatus Altiarchaeota archaeon]MBU4266075.1 hypothetical protein [Candidatus Altiarchaeota archaeon]MBU4341352.1 hypothetical protein [Candidatus Altiarchaeota archaeon]